MERAERVSAFAAVIALATVLLAPAACGAFAKEKPMPAPRATFYVAPSGNDAWPGTRTRPFVTLRAARAAARTPGTSKPRRIVLRGGDYFLTRPLLLGPEDSGLTIEAAKGEQVTLYGGRRITGWERDGDSLWAAQLPEVAEGKWDFRMLVVNGRFCTRARLPKKGHFTHPSSFTGPRMSTTGGGWKRKPTRAELTTLKYRAKDLGPWLTVKNAELTVYHMWDESVVGLKSIDRKSHTLTFSNPAGHPPGAFRVKKYVVWNVREGMTEPGQWYLDRAAGKVVYWPLPGEDMAKAAAIAPTMESIIIVRGTKGRPARDITLRGLTLSVTNTPLIAGGFGASKFQGALSIDKTANCRVQNVTIHNVGGQGIKEWGSAGLRSERGHVHHTGACGIKVGGGDALVADCHIHHVGVAYPSAIALWGGGKGQKGVRFTHNEIHDTPYTAIACGGNNHVIEHNLIYHAMQELHDGAGIYITFCKNVVVRGNFIRDIADSGGYGASAYYLDEQAEDCLVEGNLSLRVRRPSHNHMARKNILRNNVFVAHGDAEITLAKSAEYRFVRNVIWANGQIVFTNPAGIAEFRENIVYSRSGKVMGRPLRGYAAKGAGAFAAREGSLFADPKLVEFEKGVVRFAEDSPARKLGIRGLDVSGAGPRPRSARRE